MLLGIGQPSFTPSTQTPSPAPQTPSAGAGSPQPAPCRPPAPTGPPPPNFGSRRRTPTASTPPRGARRAHPPPVQLHDGTPAHLWVLERSRPRESLVQAGKSGRVSLGRGCSMRRAAGDQDPLCHTPPPLGEASGFPSEPRASSGPAGAWQRVLNPRGRRRVATSPRSQQQEPPWGWLSPLPRSPAPHACGGERSITGTPRPFPSFQESAEAEDNSSLGWKDLARLGTLTFSSSSSTRPRRRRPPVPGALRERRGGR